MFQAVIIIELIIVGDFGERRGGAVNNIYRFPEPDDILHDQTLVIPTSDTLEFRLVHYPIVTTRAFL